MAITVISNTPSREVVRQCICHNCGFTLEYTPQDIVKSYVRDYTGCTDEYKRITCPNCHKDVAVC